MNTRSVALLLVLGIAAVLEPNTPRRAGGVSPLIVPSVSVRSTEFLNTELISARCETEGIRYHAELPRSQRGSRQSIEIAHTASTGKNRDRRDVRIYQGAHAPRSPQRSRCCGQTTAKTARDSSAPPREPYLASTAFKKELDAAVGGTWQNIVYADLVRRLGDSKRIATLLDRRLDPSREIQFDAGSESVASVLDRVAAAQHASARPVGSVVYLAPHAVSRRVRSLIELRTEEIHSGKAGAKGGRQIELSKRANVVWDDLAEPKTIVADLARQFRLDVAGLDQIPHDLWRGATLPQATAAEALGLVLGQCDLGFDWVDNGQGIRIGPLAAVYLFEKRISPPKGLSATGAVAKWEGELAGAALKAAGGLVSVTGDAEHHYLAERLATSRSGSSTKSANGGAAPDLATQRITLRIRDKSAAAVMNTLTQAANLKLTFEYDAAALRAAGIDLQRPNVALDLNMATVDELLAALFRPLGLQYSLQGRTVRLTVKP